MARPKSKNVDIMNDEIVEVKAEQPAGAPPVIHGIPPEVELVETKPVDDKVPELTVEVVKPKVAVEVLMPKAQEQDKTKLPTPICDIEELTEEDKQVLIEKKVKTIMSQTQIPYIPALVKYKEPGTTAVPPMYALVDFDHRFVNEAWEFYKTNVRNPYVKDFLQLISKMFNPHKIYTRLVLFNYE